MHSAIITALAAQHNAAIITDRDGDVALLARLTGTDGLPVVRHRPDHCNFHSVSFWETATAEQAAAAVC
jgi:hypothetical protein